MAETQQSGKLAVILHADVAGSTELVRRDERLAHDRIQEAFRRFSNTIKCYHGRVRELRGDALLAEFERASDAVTAALAFQIDQVDYLAKFDDDILPNIRIGIAMGEIVIADNTLTGAGVVLAQRVEQLAESGGVCITAALHEALPDRLPFDMTNLGEQELKGFDERVRVHSVELRQGKSIPAPDKRGRQTTPESTMKWIVAVSVIILILASTVFAWLKPWQSNGTPVSEEHGESFLTDKPSIAVLPFTNMSGDPEQEYFSDGMTEDLITDLSKISGLFVIARNSTFAYKGRSLDLRVVAGELGVRYLLEGSIRRRGEEVRINAQLIDGVTGGHVWAERFDGAMSGIFELQDDVNQKIVEALSVSLTLNERKQLDRVETTNSAAYDLLLRGLEQFHRSSRATSLEARNLFLQAIALDPSYARAYSNVALTHAQDVNFYWTDDKRKSIRLGLEYAEKAIALDDSIPQIYFTRSALYLAQRKYDAAIEAARRLIDVHPNYADGYAMLAFALCWAGEFQEALEAVRRFNTIQPQIPHLALALEGRILFQLKRYKEAVGRLERSILRNPVHDRAHLLIAATYAQLGRLEDASWSVEEAIALNQEISLKYERQESSYKNAEDLEHYIVSLRMAGVPPK